jgi:hypothetical protein
MRRLWLFLLACLCVGAGCRWEELPAFQGLTLGCGLLFKSVDSFTLPGLAMRLRGTPLGADTRRQHWFSRFAAEPDSDWLLKLGKLK